MNSAQTSSSGTTQAHSFYCLQICNPEIWKLFSELTFQKAELQLLPTFFIKHIAVMSKHYFIEQCSSNDNDTN